MLIKCSECGKEVSDKASTCPHCGAPVKKEKSTEEIEKEVAEKFVYKKIDLTQLKELIHQNNLSIHNVMEKVNEIKKKTNHKKQEEKENKIFGICITIFILVVIVVVIYGIISIWNGVDGNGFLKAIGIDTNNNTIIIKEKNENELNQWKDNAMNWLGFEKIEE